MGLENYEENLKLYYESLRKDLDIILSSTIPMQKNHIKTILWINATILGLTIALFKDNFTIALSMPFMFSFLGIFVTLKGLKAGRIKAFCHPVAEAIENIKPDQYEKINGLIQMISAARKAFEKNENAVEMRAKAISSATNFTIMSVGSIFLIMLIHANLIYNKDSIAMSDEEETSSSERIKMSSGTAEPAKMLSTSHYEESTKLFIMKRVPIQKSQKAKVESDAKEDKK